MESWSFDYVGQGYVLRRSPSAEMMAGRVYGHDVEAAVVRAAYMSGVKAPEIVGECNPNWQQLYRPQDRRCSRVTLPRRVGSVE